MSILNNWNRANLTARQINTLILEYCIKTINQDWKVDWKNKLQQKWYNWFEYEDSLS